jgi:glycosyltransferase involved in cell wall biosynthesis
MKRYFKAGWDIEVIMTCKILLISNTAWYIANFRSGLIRAFQIAGYEVVAVTPSDEHVSRITALGVRFVPMEMDNKGTNPFKDLGLFLRFIRLFRREMPCVFLGFTIKPNVYGGLAAAFCGVPAINNVAGLGTAFTRDTWLTWFASRLYRAGLAKARKVFFQNAEDLSLFLQRGLAPHGVTERLPGSGVNTEWFAPDFASGVTAQAFPSSSYAAGQRGQKNPFRFLLMARLLWDKGVGEFVDAAKRLRAEEIRSGKRGDIDTEFQLLGFLDVANRGAISRETVDEWVKEGVVRYLGTVADVRPMIAQADCIILPSYYREGTPRSLLEAASMAKPIITTDTAGCRDVVVNGKTGFLCRPRDAEDLADKMLMMLNLTQEARNIMGQKGRALMVREFDERIVIDRYLKVIKDILECSSKKCRTNPAE